MERWMVIPLPFLLKLFNELDKLNCSSLFEVVVLRAIN